MLHTIQGVYQDGKIKFLEEPPKIAESQVFITFLPSQSSDEPGQMMSFGMFTDVQQSTEEDFEAAEFRDDIDDGLA